MIKIYMNAMMNTWYLAIAEIRSCSTMFRTGLFIILAFFYCFYGMMYWSGQAIFYASASLNSPAAGVFGPGNIIVQLVQPIALWFTLGIVFLAFDARSRDVRDRIFEAVDSRPVTNLELVAGRLLGTTLLMLVPAVLIIAMILLSGFLVIVAGWELGSLVEAVKALSFLVWDIVPNLILLGALTILLSMVLRFRVAVAFAVLGVMAFYYLLHAAMPLYLQTGLPSYTGTTFLASHVAPQFISWEIILNRTGMLILAVSFLLLAAGLYPRLLIRPVRSQWIGVGLSVFLVGCLTLGGLGYSKFLDLQQVERWAAIHKEHQSHQQTDIDSIQGIVEIRPGRSIKLDLNLVMTPLSDENLDAWLFSLNPGYRIERVAVDDEVIDAADYEFKDGILRIPTVNRMASGSTVHLVAQGVPDPLFAYLDSALDWRTMEPTKAKRLTLLGHRPYVFHQQYFALLSGVSWFPTSGAAYGRHVFETHKRDFFELDLEVTVPDKWIVAGPGTRQSLDAPNTGFRFNPRQPVPEFALIGSKFVRRAFETRGIEFELLLSPKHTKNLSALTSVMPALQDWVEKQIDSLQEGGLSYPLGTLSFVEVPSHLRVYGGGWNMGSAYSPPGILMMRESGFPTAKFESVKIKAEREFGDNIDRLGTYLFEYVKNYFQNDLHGGSPMVSLGEQFLGYQTTPHGKGATALHAFVNELAGSLALKGVGVFSIYFILDDQNTLASTAEPDQWFARNFINVIRGGRLTRARVWKLGEQTALADLNFETQPRNSLEQILLKSQAVSWTVREVVSQQKISAFLGRLISEHRGRTYSSEDFFEIARETGIDFESLVGDWLNSTELPGFLMREPTYKLVPSSEDGKLEYQTSIVIRNDEPVPGAVSIEYRLEDHREELWSDTVHFPGHTALRVNLRTEFPVEYLTLHPHLSLNPHDIGFRNVKARFSNRLRGKVLLYIEKYDWVQFEDDAVVVDDLSEGFSIVNCPDYSSQRDKRPLFAYFSGHEDFTPIFNYGLPSTLSAQDFAERGEYSVWYRQSDHRSHGKYSRTYVLNSAGAKESQPRFIAKLPTAGRWLLEFHVPSIGDWLYPVRQKMQFGLVSYTRRPREFGIHRFEINVGNTTESAVLNLSEAHSGWNKLGIYETSSPEVRVTLVEVTDGVAIADAIRWTPVPKLDNLIALDCVPLRRNPSHAQDDFP